MEVIIHMHTKNHSTSSARPGSKFSHPSRHSAGGPRKSFGGNFRGGRPSHGRRFTSNKRSKDERIDYSRFINKVKVVEESVVFKPEHKFTDFLIGETLKSAITKRGYVLPTPIQDKCIPHILQGSDVVGIANTGTGKTGAFLIPLIDKIIKNPRERVLVIVPTRELAGQIDQELKHLTPGMRIFSVCCVGGLSISHQIKQLRLQHNFIIGTPGRLKDLIQRKFIRLNEFKTVVLDEADRMLDMGFIADMRAVMAGMPKERHTLFFSATMSSDIEKLINEFLKTPIKISVKTGDTAKNVEQDVVKIPRGKDKVEVLHELLNQKEFNKVLVFSRTKHGTEKLAKLLSGKGFRVESIHGNKTQSNRKRALTAFKEGKVQVLVATDVAARGLDIPDVSHVINFDIPATYDDYVHRIGRTGRGNKFGKALTFIS